MALHQRSGLGEWPLSKISKPKETLPNLLMIEQDARGDPVSFRNSCFFAKCWFLSSFLCPKLDVGKVLIGQNACFCQWGPCQHRPHLLMLENSSREDVQLSAPTAWPKKLHNVLFWLSGGRTELHILSLEEFFKTFISEQPSTSQFTFSSREKNGHSCKFLTSSASFSHPSGTGTNLCLSTTACFWDQIVHILCVVPAHASPAINIHGFGHGCWLQGSHATCILHYESHHQHGEHRSRREHCQTFSNSPTMAMFRMVAIFSVWLQTTHLSYSFIIGCSQGEGNHNSMPQIMSNQDNKITEARNIQKQGMQHATSFIPHICRFNLGNTKLGAPTQRTSSASCRRFFTCHFCSMSLYGKMQCKKDITKQIYKRSRNNMR